MNGNPKEVTDGEILFKLLILLIGTLVLAVFVNALLWFLNLCWGWT